MDCPIQEPEVLYSLLYFPTPAFSDGKLCVCIAASPPAPAERWLPPSITGKQAREVLVWLLCKLEGGYLRVSGRTSLFTVKQCKNDHPCFVSPCLQDISVLSQVMKPASERAAYLDRSSRWSATCSLSCSCTQSCPPCFDTHDHIRHCWGGTRQYLWTEIFSEEVGTWEREDRTYITKC